MSQGVMRMKEVNRLVTLTAEVTANFVANNHVSASEIGEAIAVIHGAFAGLNVPPTAAAATTEMFTPAVSIRKSLTDPAKIISMIDGKPYSLLKRHLTMHGLTPDEYRARYNLPADYPMAAPTYLEKRRAMALDFALGRKRAGRPKLGIVATSSEAPHRPK